MRNWLILRRLIQKNATGSVPALGIYQGTSRPNSRKAETHDVFLGRDPDFPKLEIKILSGIPVHDSGNFFEKSGIFNTISGDLGFKNSKNFRLRRKKAGKFVNDLPKFSNGRSTNFDILRDWVRIHDSKIRFFDIFLPKKINF